MALFTWNTLIHKTVISSLGKYFWRHPRKGEVKVRLLKANELKIFIQTASASVSSIQMILNLGIIQVESTNFQYYVNSTVNMSPWLNMSLISAPDGQCERKNLIKERTLIFR